MCAGGLWGNAFEINSWGQGAVRAAGLRGQRQREGGAAMWLQQQSLQRAGVWEGPSEVSYLDSGGLLHLPMPLSGQWMSDAPRRGVTLGKAISCPYSWQLGTDSLVLQWACPDSPQCRQCRCYAHLYTRRQRLREFSSLPKVTR